MNQDAEQETLRREVFGNLNKQQSLIEAVERDVRSCLGKERQQCLSIFVIGNGGSHANAEHIVNDLILCGYPAFSINSATLTCLANDFGYSSALSSWIMVVGRPNDVLIALSGSGKSPNILAAITWAEKVGMRVHQVFGAELGQDMQQAEEWQLHLGHELYRRLR